MICQYLVKNRHFLLKKHGFCGIIPEGEDVPLQPPTQRGVMKKTPSKIHRTVVFIGLAVAIALCALSGMAHKRVRPPRSRASIEELDARAKHHFDEAARNVPQVVAEMCSADNTLKLCWLMAKDKLTGSHDTREYFASMIHDRIIVPCQRGAQVYGCAVDESAVSSELLEAGSANAKAAAYAAGGLALEAVFIRSTLASLKSVLGATAVKLSSAYEGGTACAAADGPLPIGDLIGVALAVGGTVWGISDLCEAKERLSQDVSDVLRQSIRDCRDACRRIAAR